MPYGSTEEHKKIFEQVEQLCEDKGTLLYLIKFGSHLYGTNSEHSDSDYKGIFLPDIKKLILEKKCQTITYNTSNHDVRNSSDDIDIVLWSLQHWFSLLKKGDTNAIDMLFSYTHENIIIYTSPILEKTNLFKEPLNYINLRENTSYIAYAHHQAKKYGLKGTRLHLLKSIHQYILSQVETGKITPKDRFEVILPSILENFYDNKLCFTKQDSQKIRTLFILGAGFQERITIAEAINRLEATYNKYGERAIQAEQSENVDWKAVSHAMRCILQIEELANNGHLIFPLTEADYLKDIKNAKCTWQECEIAISEGLDRLNQLVATLPFNEKIDEHHERFILSCYPELNKTH